MEACGQAETDVCSSYEGGFAVEGEIRGERWYGRLKTEHSVIGRDRKWDCRYTEESRNGRLISLIELRVFVQRTEASNRRTS